MGDEGTFVPNLVELAGALSCDRRTLTRWLKIPGNPGAAADGRYHVQGWRDWVAAMGKAPKGARKFERATAEKLDLDLELRRQQVERLRIANEEEMGRLMRTDEVCQVLGEAWAALVGKLNLLHHQTSPRLAGLDVADVSKRLREATQEALESFSLGEWAKKKVGWRTVYEAYQNLLESARLGDGPKPTA